MFKFIGITILSISCASVAATAFADGGDHQSIGDHGSFLSDDHGHGGFKMIAPEIDPASAITAVTMLIGGLAVLRGRAAKR